MFRITRASLAAALGWLVLATTAALPMRARAQSTHPPWRMALEFDPLPFLAHGYSAHMAYKPNLARRFRFTLGAFGYRLDSAAGDQSGLTRQVNAAEASIAYYVWRCQSVGLWSGSYGFLERWSYTSRDTRGKAVNQYIVPSLAVGVQWLPWELGPYLTPWAAIGVPIRNRNSTTLGPHHYAEPRPVVVAAVHVGWEVEIL